MKATLGKGIILVQTIKPIAALGSIAAIGAVLLVSLWLAMPVQDTVAFPFTDVSGEITVDTTWTLAGSPYVVTGDVTVMPGITLAIEPGTEVRFAGNYALIVRGKLFAEGQPGQEILFTSHLPSPAAGDWGVLDFRIESASSRLQHTIIEYGGNAYKPGGYCATGAVCVHTSSFTLEDSVVRHSATRGVVLSQSSASLLNNTFEHMPWEAVRLHACDLNVGECHPLILGNDFSDTQAPILHVAPLNPVLGGNTAAGNQINGYVFYVTCSVQGTNTWYAGDLPYVVPAAGGWCDMGAYNRLTTVDIQPGTVIKLANSIRFTYNTVVTATGTLEAPIVFTSLKDDSVGGDTNNDGDASSPAKRDWGMIDHFGAQVSGAYQHVIFQYGGGSQPAFGPTVGVDGGATVSVRRSQISQSGGSGVMVYNESNLTLAESMITDHRDTCIEVATTTGIVLVENNTIQGCPSGVLVNKGSPTIRSNTFTGNQVGVEVVNTIQAAPVVSPHNRFLGDGQIGVKNRYPLDGCIDARRNWWGDVSGPADSSTAADACDMADNPGLGAPVSDGVNYNPWEGGMGRPVIGWPRCGVTGQDQPVFTGRAAAGATITFYDNGVLIGQTIAAADDSFSWAPPVPLNDGEHGLSAVAELEGESSLPSPLLSLQVDSSLPFDPMGVKIRYDLHGRMYTQWMRDANGCATASGDLELPIWVRPGTNMTVTVPIATNPVQEWSPQLISSQPPAANQGQTSQPSFTQAAKVITITNNSNETIKGYKEAIPDGDPHNRVYGAYGPIISPPSFPLEPGKSVTVTIDGAKDIALVNEDQYLVQRAEVDASLPGQQTVTIPADLQIGSIQFDNRSGITITQVYLGSGVPSQPDYFGGQVIQPASAIGTEDPRLLHLPVGEYDIVAIDLDGNYHLLHVKVSAGGTPTLVEFGSRFTRLDALNDSERDLCELTLGWYGDGSEPTKDPSTEHLNMIQFIHRAQSSPHIPGGGSLTLNVERGRYLWRGRYCQGSEQLKGSDDLRMDQETLKIKNCVNVVRNPQGGEEHELKPDKLAGEIQSAFLSYSATFPMHTGPIALNICRDEFRYEAPAGKVLIDPDGYVYDATIGLTGVIAGATVTCEVYDADLESWDRWPAELYESQVNPQVTASDGYYAFFVPPGLYRVWANAAGYSPHTSPEIQVIDVIVHYNIPLQPTSRQLFLPIISR